jgi:hypothetical protein
MAPMRSSIPRVLGVLLLGSACEADPSPCGEGGRYFESDTAQFCAYLVVVGGFRCPEQFPMRRDFEEAAVCARGTPDWDDLPGGLLDYVTGEPIDGGVTGGADAGGSGSDGGAIDGAASDGGAECDPVRQLGCDAGEKCTWVAGRSGFPLGNTECAPVGPVLEYDTCTPSAGGVADDCGAGFYCIDWDRDGLTPICLAICDTTAPDAWLCTVDWTPAVFDDRPNTGVDIPFECLSIGASWFFCNHPIGTMIPDPLGRGCYAVTRGPHAGVAYCAYAFPSAGGEGSSCVEQRDCHAGHICIGGECELLCVTGLETAPDWSTKWCPSGRTCVNLAPDDTPFLSIPETISVCR